ncbi:MAG: anaerobic ribonucleoside-triphosphate reductase activating protein [Clostridia bacterium]|nr:anaerobic ribonucleoside-triphosphate reductase activating protein [Clostridia bacterium]
MNIGGMVKNSFVDYPAKIACVFFTTGCNFRCPYCHNPQLFESSPKITEEDALNFLESHKTFLEGVVVSGGEPTLQKDLKDFIMKAKKMGYFVKLDTNGTNFEVLRDLVENKLVDYVAMDIKAPMKKYISVVGNTDKLDEVKKCRDFLLNGTVDYEFRTTFSSDLTLSDLEELCKEIKGAKNFSLQKCNENLSSNSPVPEKSKVVLLQGLEIAKKYVKNCLLKGVN